jgi:ion channel
VLISIAVPEAASSRVLVTAIEGAALVTAISPRGASGLFRPVAVVAAVLVAGLQPVASGPQEHGMLDFAGVALLVALPVALVAGARKDLSVNVQTVLAAVCIYVVIGMLFAAADSGFSHVTGRAFFAGVQAATAPMYQYFSFITLCTVGYGDLTPAPGVPRAMAVSEALLGQLYLVTVIALLVGNFGRARSARQQSV